jgi:putative phosphoesterase
LALKIGIVSDVHNNAAALEAAIDLMGDVDEILCAGDSVSQVRFTNPVIGILKDRRIKTVLGNHDVEYLNRVANLPSQRGVVDEALVDWLRSQPETIEMDPGGKRLLMVHAAPWTRDYVYPGSREMKRFAEVEADFVLGGHTHTAFFGRFGRALVVNPGSTGEGRDVGEGPKVTCAILDTVTEEVQLLSFPEMRDA